MSAGYQYLVAVFFLIVFPLNVLLRSFAATVTVLYSWKNAGMPLGKSPLWIPIKHTCTAD